MKLNISNYGTQPVIMRYLAELVHAQLEMRIPEQIPEGICLDDLMNIAQKGQMNYLILGALLKLSLPEDKKEAMQQIMIYSTMRTLEQVCTIRDLQQRLEDAGIRNQLLKGSVLKEIYPTPEMREMSDIDIMIYEPSYEATEQIITSMGFYKVEEVKHHAVFVRKPCMMIEMHWALYDKNVDHEQYLYYKDTFRAKKKKDCNYCYCFSKEDFYIYMISHMAKHFYETGCGIRNLLDVYIYQQKESKNLDQKYLATELEKCGLTQFERYMRNLAVIWLDGKECDSFYESLFLYMTDCGIYGKGENGIWSQVAKSEKNDGKIRSIRRWYYFPPLAYMQENYAWLKNRAFLLPAAWGARAVLGLVHKDAKKRKKKVFHINSAEQVTISGIYHKLNLNFKK